MKSLILFLTVLCFGFGAGAQVRSVTLQASGLTCSMCSRAIYKSLMKVSFVKSVDEDLKNTQYHVQLTDPGKLSLEALRKAVVDAGFFVSRMELELDLGSARSNSDSTYSAGDLRLRPVTGAPVTGLHNWLVLDKDFLSPSEQKKWPGVQLRSKTGDDRIFYIGLKKS